MIKTYSSEIRCALPDKTNSTGICVKLDNLSTIVRTKDETVSGDIITLVMSIKSMSFSEAMKYLHNILGLKFEFISKPEVKKIDPLDIFKRSKAKITEDLKLYDKSLLDDYINIPHINFVREGILPLTQQKFNIGYSDYHKRITIPHRYWNGDDNNFVGCFGRTIVEDFDILDVPKYYGLKPYQKSYNLYGLYENYEDIQKARAVLVFESEKSVLKCDSYKIYNSVALGGHELSIEQEKILLGLNVEIIFCLDKDIKEDFIIKLCDRFKNTRKVSYILDKYDLLDEKDAPVDKGLKKFNYLLKYRINYGKIII